MKIFLDDIRDAPDESWIVVRTFQDAIDALSTGMVTTISLDHDLGEEMTGYDVVKWIENQVYTEYFSPPEILIHSANPVGRANMEAGIKSLYRHARETQVTDVEYIAPHEIDRAHWIAWKQGL